MEIKDKEDLKEYFSTGKCSEKIQKEIRQSYDRVQECIDGGAQDSVLVVAETQEEEAIEGRYQLKNFEPETDEEIPDEEGVWIRRVYVFDDAGDGMVLYIRPTEGEKQAEFDKSAGERFGVDGEQKAESRGISCHRERENTYVFGQETRMMTRQIAETLPLEIGAMLWRMIDEEIGQGFRMDYLQVFTFESLEGGILAITKTQERPFRKAVLYIDQMRIPKDFNRKKIFVIDDETYSTMLYAEEY